MRLHFGRGEWYFEFAPKTLSLKVCVTLIILSLFLSVQKVPILQELVSLQLVWWSIFQADLGDEESAAGQIYKPLRGFLMAYVNTFTTVAIVHRKIRLMLFL